MRMQAFCNYTFTLEHASQQDEDMHWMAFVFTHGLGDFPLTRSDGVCCGIFCFLFSTL
jgi:hypothetical protein